jgi:acyl carrier protein
MSDSFEDIGIDSLDGLVMMMYLTDVYGVSEEVSKGWVPTTLQEIYDLLMAYKTKEPTSIDDVIEYIK